MKLAFTAIVVFATAFTLRAQDPGACSTQLVQQDFAPFCRMLETNRSSSLAHYRIGELFFLQNNYQSSANEFREVLNGDLDPKWTEVGAHQPGHDFRGHQSTRARGERIQTGPQNWG